MTTTTTHTPRPGDPRAVGCTCPDEANNHGALEPLGGWFVDPTCGAHGWATGAEDDDECGCDGHESLNGADMGRAVYCDGTCR